MGNCNPGDWELDLRLPLKACARGKKSFGLVPQEEIRKDMLVASCNAISRASDTEEKHLPFPSPAKGGLERLLRVYGYVFGAMYKWRKKTGAQSPILISAMESSGGEVGYPSAKCP